MAHHPHEHASEANPALRRFALRRGRHRWQFAFEDGDAAALDARLVQLARDPDAPLDEGDVRMLRRQIARLLHSPAARPSA